MNTIDEIIFFLEAYKKAEAANKHADFDKRIAVLFAEGQMTEKSYKILKQIVTPEPVKLKVAESKRFENSSDPCSRTSTVSTRGGC